MKMKKAKLRANGGAMRVEIIQALRFRVNEFFTLASL